MFCIFRNGDCRNGAKHFFPKCGHFWGNIRQNRWALLLGLAACTQDEAGFLPEGAEGTPIVFTATGLNPAATATAGTRAPVDGNWRCV